MSWLRRLFSFPGAPRSPEVVLLQTLDKLPRIKGVVLVIQWDDGTIDADWSAMKMSELCFAARGLSLEVDRAMNGEARR